MCKVTGSKQFDFNMYKAVVWNVNKILSHFQNIHLTLKEKILHYRLRKTLLSNCLHGVTELREVLSVLRACMYHSQINRIRSLIQLEEAGSEVFTSVTIFSSKV